MPSNQKSVEDRLEATLPDPPERQFTLFAVQEMWLALEAKSFTAQSMSIADTSL